MNELQDWIAKQTGLVERAFQANGLGDAAPNALKLVSVARREQDFEDRLDAAFAGIRFELKQALHRAASARTP